MTDARARARERAAATTGAPEDRARVLADHLRQGTVTAEHLSVAAWLGDAAAASVVRPWPAPAMATGRWSAWHALRYAPIEHVVRVRVAVDCAERVLPLVEANEAQDRLDAQNNRYVAALQLGNCGRPRAAIAAARAWIDSPSADNRVAAARAAVLALHGAGPVYRLTREAAQAAVHACSRAAAAAGGGDGGAGDGSHDAVFGVDAAAGGAARLAVRAPPHAHAPAFGAAGLATYAAFAADSAAEAAGVAAAVAATELGDRGAGLMSTELPRAARMAQAAAHRSARAWQRERLIAHLVGFGHAEE